MPVYRLQFLNSQGKPTRAIELECVDDTQAVAVVQEHLIHDPMELWEGERLVRRFGAPGG